MACSPAARDSIPAQQTLVNFFDFLHFDWLGTRRELPNPTSIGFFGRLRLDTDHYVPIFNLLLTGHPYAFTAAQTGEFGSWVQGLWWLYMIGIYILVKDVWTITLGTIAIHRIQKIPVWAGLMIMLFGYVLWYYGVAGTFVR